MIDPRLDDMSIDDHKNLRDNYDVFVHITKKKGEETSVIHFLGNAPQAFGCFGQILKSVLPRAEDEGESKIDVMNFYMSILIGSALLDEPSLCVNLSKIDLSKMDLKNGGTSNE